MMTMGYKRFATSVEDGKKYGWVTQSLSPSPTQESRITEAFCTVGVPCQFEMVMALPSLSLAMWAAPARVRDVFCH